MDDARQEERIVTDVVVCVKYRAILKKYPGKWLKMKACL